ncbi:MAG: thiamine-phosphate kinase [Alphaproteobacteria bacterium]|nr:thiamine-phosphate kinase [Alphaproteobacteria bacterium]
MRENDIIERFLKPLSVFMPGSLSLQDDAAYYHPHHGKELVITQDAMVEGVHFLPDMEPALIAKRLIRTNLSDLAAKGAVPKSVLLSMILSPGCDESWVSTFTHGFAEDCSYFKIGLIGGDTVIHSGSLVLSLTALGEVAEGMALTRLTARPGDLIYVSGELGVASLGLMLLKGDNLSLDKTIKEQALNRFQQPEPRLKLGQSLLGLASASMDISDGVILDLKRLCKASNVGAMVHHEKIPVIEIPGTERLSLMTFGDDYELLFTIPPDMANRLDSLSSHLKIALTCIGEITAGSHVSLIDRDGKNMALSRDGFEHHPHSS